MNEYILSIKSTESDIAHAIVNPIIMFKELEKL